MKNIFDMFDKSCLDFDFVRVRWYEPRVCGAIWTISISASVRVAKFPVFAGFYQKNGLKYAKTRRRLYRIRHEKDRHKRLSNGWLADKLLW